MIVFKIYFLNKKKDQKNENREIRLKLKKINDIEQLLKNQSNWNIFLFYILFLYRYFHFMVNATNRMKIKYKIKYKKLNIEFINS